MKHTLPWLVLPALLVACASDPAILDGASVGENGAETGKADKGGIPTDHTRRVDYLQLFLDVDTLSGEATIRLEPSDSGLVTFEAGGLDVQDVSADDGPLEWEHTHGELRVFTRDSDTVHVTYRFRIQSPEAGLGPNLSTVIWPTFCGNLFPCLSDPSDGWRFELEVAGYDSDLMAVYPEVLGAEAPPYTLALAIGDYRCEELGQTAADTTVSVCWLPKGKTKALKGTANLVAAFDWLEQTIGPYTFGSQVASIAAEWGEDGAGGMEHHPFWHVATSEMELEITHVHEAAHGWFGTGVRIGCWEDFVLSEGTVTYLAARALGAVTDAETEAAIWADYEQTLLDTLEDEDVIAWPESDCEVDLLKDGLWSNIVYMKGALFFRDLGDEIGAEVVDSVLAGFYQQHVGRAAHFEDLLVAIEDETGFDARPTADFWLRTRGNPWEEE